MFQDLGSSPATMEAGKAADCIGCIPGNDTEQADAEQEYIQAELRGAPTWVLLPVEQWHPSWKKRGLTKPVVPLRKAP